jgi:hypothetical protein
MADSKKIDDGGPAFSGSYTTKDFYGREQLRVANGMSFRDWLAGQAIGSVIRQCALDTNVNANKAPAQYFAEKAYEIADAMIAARKAGA